MRIVPELPRPEHDKRTLVSVLYRQPEMGDTGLQAPEHLRAPGKEEGGRHTPFHNKYRPQFYFRTTDVTGEIMLPDGVEMVMPGDNLTIEVELIQKIDMSKGLRFAIREGGRTVGAGVVAKIIE